MRKILKHQTSFLTKLAFAGSYGNETPRYFALLIELLSCIQILYIILTTSFSASNEKNLLIVPQLRSLFSFLGLYDGTSAFETEISTELVWYTISAGLCAYTIFLSVLAVFCLKEKNLKKGIVTLCTVLTTIHSKVLFCPIYYFYINSILNHERCAINNQSLNVCGNIIKAFTLIFVMINGALAVLKEVLFYQSYKNSNPFATKNNFYALIQLTHKITVLPIIVLSSPSLVAGSILNFFFTLPCLILLLLKLPYYNITMLKTTVYLSTITTTLSFILIWKTLVTSRYRIFELILILTVPVFIKVVHERLNAIFEKILSLRATSPEHIMHLYTLTEHCIFHSEEVDMNRNSKYKTLFKYGVLEVTGLNVNAMENIDKIKNFKDEVNLVILDELLRCYKTNSKSRALMLFITQFYMERIKNASQTVVFIQKMQNIPLSIPIQNTLVKIKEELKDMLFIAYSQKDPSLEFIKYFKYREISDTLKATIASEVQLHSDFWQIMAKDKVEVRRVIHIARQADILASKVNRMWEQNEQDFIKNFPAPLMLYRVYLSLIRGVPHIAEKYIDDSIGVSSKVTKSMEKWFAQEKASIVGSMQKGTLGIVLDASSSVQNLFNIKKEDLIGRNVNILTPSMVQEKHNFLIDRYNQKHEYALDVNKNVYGKTVDGQFFDAQLEIKVYPYIDKGIGLIGMLTKKHACELMFFLDMRGNIIDCSSELLNDFRSNFTLSKHINIEEIAPELRKINEAFNVINVPKSLDLSTYTPGLKRKKTGIDSASKAKIWSKVMKEDGQPPKESRKSIREHQIFTFPEKETQLDSAARLISTRQNETQRTDAFLPQTTEREQIMMPLETNLETMKFKEEPEAILPQSKNIAALFLTHLTTKQANPVSKEQARREFLNLNEAEKICEEFSNKKEKKVSFFTQDALSNTFTKLTYFVKVDIFWFENQFYKVVKVRKPTKKDMTMEERTPRWHVGSKRESQLGFKSYGNSLFDAKLKNEKARKPISRTSYSGSIQGILGKKDGEEAKNTLLSIEALQDNEEKSPDLFVRKKNKETKLKSDIKIEKTLYDLLRKGKESTFTRIYFSAFYFAMFLMVILATINFVFIRSSFKQIELAATLVDTDSERHVNLIKMWSICNALYTFLIQNKTMLYLVSVYDKLVPQQAEIITAYTRDLNSVLPDISSNEIINAFYTKDIHFWEAFADNPIDASYDVFNGINILVEKLLLFKGATRYKLLNDPDSAIFALNNTVNDLSISAMAEVTVTVDIRNEIYASNLSLLLALFIIEVAAMVIIFLSLIGLAFKIIKSKKSLFTVLSTMPFRSFDLRSKELVQFRNCIQESLESRKFIMQLNSFIDEGSVAKNEAQTRDFKFKDESKFRFFSIKVKSFTLLFLAFVLFAGILSFQIVSTTHSSQSIEKLKKIDAASSLAKKTRYQVNMLNGNIIYWLNFYGRANVKIYNEDPGEQLDSNLAYIGSVNSQIVSIFTAQDNFYSPDIDTILHSDPCSFAKSLSLCSVATKGEILGLLGVNLQFHDLVATYSEIFRSNMTIQNADKIAYAYLMGSQAYIATTDGLYSFIRASLFKTLSDTINEEDGTNRPLYIGTCFVCVIVTLLVRLIVLKSFKRFDISKYKILMLIPQRTLLNNKAIVLYVKNEFRKELNSLL